MTSGQANQWFRRYLSRCETDIELIAISGGHGVYQIHHPAMDALATLNVSLNDSKYTITIKGVEHSETFHHHQDVDDLRRTIQQIVTRWTDLQAKELIGAHPRAATAKRPERLPPAIHVRIHQEQIEQIESFIRAEIRHVAIRFGIVLLMFAFIVSLAILL